MSMLQESDYDFAVFGESPFALWAGLTLLKSGKRVIVFPMGTDNGMNGIPKLIAEDFQIEPSHYPDRKRDPIQIIYAGHRFKVGGTREEFLKECHFHLGHELTPIETLTGELARGLEFLATGTDDERAPPELWNKLFDRVQQNVFFDYEEGWLTKTLLSKMKEKGAEVKEVGDLTQIFIEKGSLIGVQIKGATQVVSVREGFVGTDWHSLEKLMSEKRGVKTLPKHWTFQIRFSCSPEVVPKGLSHRMIYLEKNAPPLHIIYPKPGEFILKSNLPFEENSLDRGIQRKLALRMLKVCERLIPDLSYNLKTIDPDIRNPEKAETEDLPRLFPFESLSLIPLSRYIYGGAQSSLSKKAPLKGFYIASTEASPAHGYLGALSSTQAHLEGIFKRLAKK